VPYALQGAFLSQGQYNFIYAGAHGLARQGDPEGLDDILELGFEFNR